MQGDNYLRPAFPLRLKENFFSLSSQSSPPAPTCPSSNLNKPRSISITAPLYWSPQQPNLNLSSITNTMSGPANGPGTEGEMAPAPMYAAEILMASHQGLKLENDRLRSENERLCAENERLCAENDRLCTENNRLCDENAKLEAELAPKGGQIPAQFIGTSYDGTKRKVEEEMYADDERGNKKLRTTDSMEFGGLSDANLNGVCQFVSIAQNEVLRVAAKGGLINHLYFKITPRGILGITPIGMERIDLFHRSKTEPKLIEDWKLARGAEFSKKVRKIITESGFQNHSHPSLHCLAEELEDEGLSMDTLRSKLVSLESQTRNDVERLEAYVKELTRIQRNGRQNGQVDKEDLLAILRRISRPATDGSVRPLIKIIEGAEGLCEAFRFLGELEKIVDGYRALYAASEKMEDSIEFPAHQFAPAAPRVVEG
ncbi:unnamed protein product [Clonostachys byssicola]|uniref:Uncharacterized protein n=1 Tax=Clonostachys byssicola TaxID=160290 RepID=A0A9N9YDG1_9HYPO|nr:unnamed protein product [Clonostachys byssicola]